MIFIHYIPFHSFFFFNDTATTEIYTLSLHDALPILFDHVVRFSLSAALLGIALSAVRRGTRRNLDRRRDRKSTRLNSSHSQMSYAVFCLKIKRTLIAFSVQSTRSPFLSRHG